MTMPIVVPSLGESVTEASIVRWLKAPGETVAVDEPLVVLETDKVTIEIPAQTAGVLSSITAPAGAIVLVGDSLGTIGGAVQGGETPDDGLDGGLDFDAIEPSEDSGSFLSDPFEPPAVMPAAKKLAADAGLDLGLVFGTGKDGRITKSDVLETLKAMPQNPAGEPEPEETSRNEAPPAVFHAAAATMALESIAAISAASASRAPQEPAAPAAGREDRVPMTRLRKRIAERLKEAQNTAAMLTTFNEADMTALTLVRERYKEDFEKKHGVKLGFMSFFVKAVVAALKEWPAVNASIDGDDIVYKHYYDIGVAVGTPQGLVVPVLRGADGLSFAEVEKNIGALGRKARDGKLAMEDLQGGTFTISNGGVYGSLLSTPILNPPQSGILGMHKIQQRPVIMPDGTIKARPMMYLALSYDHRIIDGREAVSFLIRVKECVEDPARILLEL